VRYFFHIVSDLFTNNHIIRLYIIVVVAAAALVVMLEIVKEVTDKLVR
jgi:hypothetical protein